MSSSDGNNDDIQAAPKGQRAYNFKAGQPSANPAGRPKGTVSSDKINEDDRDYYGTDSRKFLERALLRAKNWEEGLKYAKELRMLQHPSLQSVQTRNDNVHTLTLRWSRPDEIASNEKTVLELSVDGGQLMTTAGLTDLIEKDPATYDSQDKQEDQEG